MIRPTCEGIGSVRPEGEPVHSHAAEDCEDCDGCGRLCDDCGDPIPVSVQKAAKLCDGADVCRDCQNERKNDPDTIADERYHFQKENPK